MYFEFLLTLIVDNSYQINLFISKLNNLLIGAPGKSRTSNLQIRSLAFYPIELRAFMRKENNLISYFIFLIK